MKAIHNAQAKHESANFTSAVFRDCSNAFGYSATSSNVSCPGHSFYKAYNNLSESVNELCQWIKRRQREGKFPSNLNEIQTPEQYALLLKNSGYYEDSFNNYANGLQRWFVKILPYGTAIIGILLIVFVLIINKGNKTLLK